MSPDLPLMQPPGGGMLAISPDGARLAYLSDRGGTVHIRVRRMDLGQEAEAGDAPLSFAWSPGGKGILKYVTGGEPAHHHT